MKKTTFGWLLGPLICFFLFALILVIEREGVQYQYKPSQLTFLPADFSPGKPVDGKKESVLLYDSGWNTGIQYQNAISFVLQSMAVAHDAIDVRKNAFPDLTQYETAVLAFNDLDVIADHVIELCDWVESGGRALFSVTPADTGAMKVIYTKLGIEYGRFSFAEQSGLTFITNLLPGSGGLSFGSEAVMGNFMALRVRDDCRVHIVSNDEFQTPVLWECDYGKGKFIVCNSDIMANREARGIVCAAYSLLEDACAYPVINASLYFIDDFPAPVPEGYHELILKQYGRNTEEFYKNIWWPDMLQTSGKYNLKYTGLLVETYNDNVTGPFAAERQTDNFKYFGGMLLKNGGELGLHGYNHMPLCLEDYDYMGLNDYKHWPDTEKMAEATKELIRFGTEMFPENEFITYVPPSNILSDEGEEMIIDKLTQIKVISDHYFSTELVSEEEFKVSDKGIIYVPRIVSGYELTPYLQWSAMNVLGFLYINSNFIHPDDVLDDERGAQKGWPYLKTKFDEQIAWFSKNAPGLRSMTASQGAAAVERYASLTVHKQITPNDITLSLEGFYDEAWLMLRLNRGIYTGIEGGSITRVCDNLFLIHATQPVVTIRTKKG